jgi:hypothetical protein
MKRISLMGLVLTLVLLVGATASAAVKVDVNYVSEDVDISKLSYTISGYTLRLGASYDLKNSFVEGAYITGKQSNFYKRADGSELSKPEGDFPLTGAYLGWNYIAYQDSNYSIFAGPGYLIRSFGVKTLLSEELIDTDLIYEGIVAKGGITFDGLPNNFALRTEIIWAPSMTPKMRFNQGDSTLIIYDKDAKASAIDAKIAVEYRVKDNVLLGAGYTKNKITEDEETITSGGFFLGANIIW